MAGYKGPIEFPILGANVSIAVRRFAEKNDCQSEAWCHDEPVWLVRKEAEPGFYQQVQVAAFLTEEGENLYFTPLAYVASKDWSSIKITPCAPDSGKAFKLSLEELYPMKPEDRIKAVFGQIDLAWTVAKSLDWRDATA
jgi:hypothetical protein